MAPQHSPPSRRTIVRGAAWTMPVVALSVAAPAFAASPCGTKTPPLAVTWSSSSTTSSQTGTTSNGTTVNVAATYTATTLGRGSIGSGNLTAQTVAATRDCIAVVNNSPTAGATMGSANFQTVTFNFTRPVFGLTLSIDDIDRGGGYWDYVGLAATPAQAPTPTFSAGTTITGGGTYDNGWRTTAASGGDNLASQAVTVTYANGSIGLSSLGLRFWSTELPLGSAVHLLRIRQMSFRTCV